MTKSRCLNKPKFVWTDKALAELSIRYPHEKTECVAEAIGCSLSSAYSKAKQLGLKKTSTFLASPAAGRLCKGHGKGGSTQFKKGQAAWNKGMKGLDIGGKETRFKPGHRGGKAVLLYQPIGTERISKDGYLERKINDDMPLQKRWRAVHLVVWEAANGPLPKGHAITFKDGNKQNTALENLQLISRADLMRRNTYHRYGPEIAKLVQLRGAINRQINKRKKNEEQLEEQH